jgi:hypothetical protein
MDELAWKRFLQGCWTREPPTVKGTYPVANRDGQQCGYRHVTFIDGVMWDQGHEGQFWSAFWWSEPMPELPEPPHWEDKM